MKRRDALKAAVAPVMLPALLSAQIPKGKRPLLLISDQDAAAVAFTQIIIPTAATPGAKQPQMNRYFDLLHRDGPAGERERFTAGLEWLDDYTTKKNGPSFGGVTSAQQTEILAEPGAAEGMVDFERGLILVR